VSARPQADDVEMGAPPRVDEAATGAPPRAVVTAAGLSKWYGQVIGLNDVTVNVPAGVTGLLGPNGAGKSTFMKLMTGQLRPSKGTITVLGEPAWGHPALFFRLGFCPDQDAFYERMTGLEWVAALARLGGMDEASSVGAARRALETVGLSEAADRKIGGYSKGMRQRVKLAQAVAHDPELLVLDEPLSGMDPIGRRRTIRLIREWAREGRTIIVSSHILHEIEAMTSNILLINHGRIVAEGNVHQIRDLIDSHPHTVRIRAADPRGLARRLLAGDDVISLRFEPGALEAQTAAPDAFYRRLTQLAASGEAGEIAEVTSPDDNLQAVFDYLVK
jgi:ABC-2 type transport system ATP-binding protein